MSTFHNKLHNLRREGKRVIVALPHDDQCMGWLLEVEEDHLIISDNGSDPEFASIVPLARVQWVREVS